MPTNVELANFTVAFSPRTNSQKVTQLPLLTLLYQIIISILSENICLSSILSISSVILPPTFPVLQISSSFVSFRLPRCQLFFTCRERNENRISSDSGKIRSEILSAVCFHVERLSPLACLAVISKFITGAEKERSYWGQGGIGAKYYGYRGDWVLSED